MLKDFPFGEFLPDLAPDGTLTDIQNAFPIANGYAPVPSFSPVTTALASTIVGGAAFVGSDGTSALLGAINGTTVSVPTLNAPSTSTTGGTLAAATYYYKVTAINANGETTASNEVSQATTGTTSTVSLSWNAVAGATGYRVYRGTAAGGENVYYAPGNVTSYTDTGAASTGGTPPASNTATTAKLSRYSGSWTDVFGAAVTGRWRFTQFGDNVIFANGSTLSSYGILTGTASTIASAPTATDVATVRDFVMAIGINGNKQLCGWSGFNNSTQWPMDGVTNQSDQQSLPDGGEAVAIVGGEYGIILQKRAIRRVTYVGGEVIFQFDVISPEVGAMAQGSVCNAGRLIFFLSERGFQMTDGEQVIPIGVEKIDRWFFRTYSRADIANIWSAINPRRSLAMWAMVGTPGRIICYNWVLKSWSVISIDVQALFTGFTSNTSVDSLGNIDTLGTSLDDPIYAGGNPLLLIASSANILGTLSGTALQASFTLSNVEPTPGRRSRIRSLRLKTDAESATINIGSKLQAGDTDLTVSTSEMRTNGKMPIRANGRFNDITTIIPAGTTWSYAEGFELEYESGDGR